MNAIFVNEKNGLLRSGWRASIFLFVYVFVVALLAATALALFAATGIGTTAGTGAYFAANSLSSLASAILLGWLCGKFLEKLPYRALGTAFTDGWLKHFFLGSIIGAATLAFAVLVGSIFGGLRFSVNDAALPDVVSSIVYSFAVFAVAAAFEEALFRGYFLQTFARSGLAWLAILLTSVFFGAVHAGNPNANVISTANTVLAGVWFSIAYLKTRDLWFVWGLHLMWNWMQGSFFGIEVSGLKSISETPLLKEIDSGPTWLTGETYGIEGGILCTVAIVISMAAIWFAPFAKPDPSIPTESKPCAKKQ